MLFGKKKKRKDRVTNSLRHGLFFLNKAWKKLECSSIYLYVF